MCPFIKKACMEHACVMYTHITMADPQTGVNQDKFSCSLALLPMMVVEGARQTRGVQSAVESMRNEVINRQDTLNNLITQASRRPTQIRDVDPTAQISDAQEKNGR
jgi:urease gamma subunit